ncbi:MAG TPA: type II secretion system protein [Bacillus bacterium]|nr:type II secretion system protein [Bacillus sp. (in: firmicutes)]
MLKRMLKNEKGLTLIELLAVVVILGIIAAFAVPAIGGIIDNTKKDAHVANAQQMISATKLALTADPDLAPIGATSTTVTLGDLITNGYLQEKIKDPDDKAAGAYDEDESKVVINRPDKDSPQLTYTVTLKGSKREINGIDEGELGRDKVE